MGVDAGLGEAAGQRVRRRRQRVHRDASRRALPPEFTLLRFEPEPWTGADVIVWVKMMAWDLSANYSFELLRHDLIVARSAPERMAQLMPPYAADGFRSCRRAAASEAGGSHGSGGLATNSTHLDQPDPPDPP